MNFLKSYHLAVRVNKMANIESNADLLIPNIYQYSSEHDTCPSRYLDFLHLLAGGNIEIEFPVSFSFQALDCCLLLYTGNGGGRISYKGMSISITENQLLLFDCRQPFTLQPLLLPWTFKLFFFTGKDMELFKTLLNLSAALHFTIPEFSGIHHCFSSLLSVSTHPDTYDLIAMHKNLTEILSSLCLSLRKNTILEIPCTQGYLLEMRDHLEHHYNDSFSLNKYEELFNISKYRLCREFSAAYGMPPLKYLTKRRLEKAKKMLLTTDWTVHEISSKIGYENVNHFINLFKKDTGTTPNAFRQKALSAQSASHCPVQ